MKHIKISQRLDELLHNGINELERDELADKLTKMSPKLQALVMRQIVVIWPVSSALFLTFVDQAEQAYSCLNSEQFIAWVKAVLDIYESQGLHQAQLFMADVKGRFWHQLNENSSAAFTDIESRLRPYLISLSGYQIKLAPATTAFTAINTIYLPERISIGRTERQNFILYKLTATFLLGLDTQGTFSQTITESDQDPLNCFFSSFSNKGFAKDLFYTIEALRIMIWIAEELPGLIQESRDVMRSLASQRPELSMLTAKDAFIEKIQQLILSIDVRQEPTEYISKELSAIIGLHILMPNSVTESKRLTRELYNLGKTMPGPYHHDAPLLFMGELMTKQAFQGLENRRKERKEAFIQALAAILHKDNKTKKITPSSEQEAKSIPRQHVEDGILMFIAPNSEAKKPAEEEKSRQDPTFITVGSEDIALDKDTAEMASKITQDMGAIPGDYISSAIGKAGGLASLDDVAEQQGTAISGPILYDEWDYRRAGFRKNWCRLTEKSLAPVQGTFYANTLNKYKGQINRLERQFEAMLTQDNFVRRQREGNDIDLDAVMEAISDNMAGLSPSERLFIRLQKNDRDIATLFLVDMSNSTEGWVGLAIKESLVLMCEALSVLGDRYAIYGFSGMRRLRSEFYTIKTFKEAYDESVKGKISAITPLEYTRMGPAIRHASHILTDIEARVRLLVTLSDGKPEDYDDYKGAYAIEDTRHALLEAKGKGIHPFCITIDKKATDYVRHMYGEMNYALIDDVKKLPGRIPEIYRNLTT